MTLTKRINRPNTPLPDDATPEQKAAWTPRITVDVPLTDEEVKEYNDAAAIHEVKMAAFKANQYKRDRKKAYPSLVDQLDVIYHQGLDAWKEQIKAVKDRFSKGGI